MKKKKKITILKKLQKENEGLWKACVTLRDGNECMVKKYFPHIPVMHSNVFQVDHCFSRMNKELFLDIANGTRVCSSCNLRKQFDDGIRMAIYDIVKKREGEDTFTRMREIVEMKRPFLNWKNILWQEEQNKILKDIRGTMKENNENRT